MALPLVEKTSPWEILRGAIELSWRVYYTEASPRAVYVRT